MSRYEPDPKCAESLKGKVVVVTGGASGIGAATVRAFHDAGANVVFGDIQTKAGAAVAEALSKNRVKFLKTDVTKYEDHLALFDLALHTFGRVDIAVSNAAVGQGENWMKQGLDLESVKEPPSTLTLDVNILGTLYFCRVAAVYLSQHQSSKDDKSIILLASTAGVYETAGLPLYSTTKHAVMGLMRSLRRTLPSRGIRINAICPWVTDTPMGHLLAELWKQQGLVVNSAAGVANVIVGASADQKVNGKAFVVMDNVALEIEDNLTRLQPQIFGDDEAKQLAVGEGLLGSLLKNAY